MPMQLCSSISNEKTKVTQFLRQNTALIDVLGCTIIYLFMWDVQLHQKHTLSFEEELPNNEGKILPAENTAACGNIKATAPKYNVIPSQITA